MSAGQLAVTYKGRLVLARGYSTSESVAVQPTSLFRIASLSKSLTAAAILRLEQDGKLKLGSKVVDILGITATGRPALVEHHAVATPPAPRRLEQQRLR